MREKVAAIRQRLPEQIKDPTIQRFDVAALPIAVASTASYLLILWVFRHAAIAPAAALRDTSSIFAVVIAVVWLREPFTGLRLFAILLSAAAVPLLRLS